MLGAASFKDKALPHALLNVYSTTRCWGTNKKMDAWMLSIDVPSLNLMQKQKKMRRISFKMLNFHPLVDFKTPPIITSLFP